MAGPARVSDRYQRRAVLVVGVVAGLGLLALVGRLVHINTALSPRLTAIGDAQRHGLSVLPGRRGTIFDARGRTVAASRQVYGVFADPSAIEQPALTAARVGELLDTDAGELEDRIRNSTAPRFCWLTRKITAPQADAIRAAKIPGVHLTHQWERHYPLKKLLAAVTGFVGQDGDGLEGLELACDAHLRGQDGQTWSVRDALRRSIRETNDERRRATPPRDGGHVVLTVDSVIQGFVETHLREHLQAFEAASGVGVVMDPKTADVLAMATWPTFDPNHYTRYPRESWRNQAVTDVVEPGSTFKPFVASGALAGGFVEPDEVIDCHDGLYVTGRRRLHDSHPHGDMTFDEVIIKSSNIGMAIVGERMGNPALHEIITRFGFGRPTGVDFPGEASGLVLPLSRWNSYSTTSVPMGHEVAVTPLQLVTAFSAILNDGVLLRPRLIRALLAEDGSVQQEFVGPEPVRRVLPTQTARRFARDVLVRVVNEGTGKRARLQAYQVLGKTGTAQMPYKDRRGYEPDAYVGTFIGAAPAHDPQVAVVVMVKKPNARKGYYGGTVAAPAVRAVIADTLAYLQVPPDTEDGVALR